MMEMPQGCEKGARLQEMAVTVQCWVVKADRTQILEIQSRGYTSVPALPLRIIYRAPAKGQVPWSCSAFAQNSSHLSPFLPKHDKSNPILQTQKIEITR